MRRLLTTVLLFGAFQVMTPCSAFALWGVFERLSGPGSFSGPDLEFRLVCFGREQGAEQIALPGIESSCPTGDTGKKARASINLGFRLFKADADPQYAGNHEIRLTMLVPSFSWSVFGASEHWDFLDVGIGGGVYWFSSEGFSSFSGTVLEPAWFDFHVPPSVGYDRASRQLTWWGAVSQTPTVRIGWAFFPAGFEANAFNATGSAARRIPAEGVFGWSVFLNLEPLVRFAQHP
jgi:hypothetical protein